MHLMNLPLPAALPECDKPSSFDYFERKGMTGSTTTGVFFRFAVKLFVCFWF